MDVIWMLIWSVTYLVGAVLYEIYIVHMFQQNSYKPREYREWMQVHSNVGRLLGKCLYAVISVPLVLAGNVGCMIAACVMNAMTILVNKPRQAKKPLVYTMRVRRMLVTTVILYGLCVLLSLLSGEYWPRACGCVLLLLFILQPFLILLVNLINRPLEQAIDRHYVKDAARILQEMPNLTVIGVTGSYGKTSVKYFLNTLLSSQFNVLQTPGNYNTTLGVVRTIREQMKPFHEIFICEMGAREVGDIKEI